MSIIAEAPLDGATLDEEPQQPCYSSGGHRPAALVSPENLLDTLDLHFIKDTLVTLDTLKFEKHCSKNSLPLLESVQ